MIAEIKTVWIIESGKKAPRFITAYPKFLAQGRNLSMIHELETVVLAHDIEQYGLKQGDIGAVVHCYYKEKAFEVEFVTGKGDTIAVLTLTKKDVRPIQHQEILHVRKLLAA